MLAHPFGMNQVRETLRMERAAPAVQQGPHASGGRHRLALQRHLPAGGIRGGVRVETARAEHAPVRHLAVARIDQVRARVQRVQYRVQAAELAGIDQVDLVDDDDVGHFDLVDQHVHDGTVVVVMGGQARSDRKWAS